MSYCLYDYFRSTASYRVRIVLNLKNLTHQLKEIHLVNNGGEQFSDNYRSINPQQLVPTLTDDNAHLAVSQSLAIIDYLEALHPEPRLYPSDVGLKALVQSLALQICCDIHPLNNLRVLKYLTGTLSLSEQQKMDWYHHWIHQGFQAIEKQLHKYSKQGEFCFGNQPTLADICLIPQVYNAKRFDVDLTNYPMIQSINTHCLTLEAFSRAAPTQ